MPHSQTGRRDACAQNSVGDGQRERMPTVPRPNMGGAHPAAAARSASSRCAGCDLRTMGRFGRIRAYSGGGRAEGGDAAVRHCKLASSPAVASARKGEGRWACAPSSPSRGKAGPARFLPPRDTCKHYPEKTQEHRFLVLIRVVLVFLKFCPLPISPACLIWQWEVREI